MSRFSITLRVTALLLPAMLQSCAPVCSDLQSARTVGKGNVQITPSYSSVTWKESGQSEKVQNVMGAHLASGLHQSVQLRMAYARVSPAEGDGGLNVVGFGPKVALVPDRLAFYVPVGFVFGEEIIASETWGIHPTLIFTLRPHRLLEINPSGKILIGISQDRETLVAFNLGFGLSANFDRWAIRPEIGFLINPGESGNFVAYSVGLMLAP